MVFKCERPNLLKNFVPVTIGEHIRKKRLESGLTLEKLSKKWGIGIDRLLHWERGRRVPFELYPMIFSFLGYLPMQIDTLAPAERLIALRRVSRMTQKRLAKMIGVSIENVSDFEIGIRTTRMEARKIYSFLNMVTDFSGSVSIFL